MAYADLTAEQKASLDAWMNLFRGTCGELARLNNHQEVVNTEYTGVITTILGDLVDGDLIPNASGLDGAESVTKYEVTLIMNYMQAVLAYNTTTHRQNLAKACGERNLIG